MTEPVRPKMLLTGDVAAPIVIQVGIPPDIERTSPLAQAIRFILSQIRESIPENVRVFGTK